MKNATAKDNSGKPDASKGARPVWGWGSAVMRYLHHEERVNKLDPVTGEPELDAKGNPVKVTVELEKPKVIVSVVFNATQVDGIPPLERQAFTWDPHERAEEILYNSGVTVEHSLSNQAAYNPSLDVIMLPEKDQFPDAEKFYDTGLHELAHATGHESRLARGISNNFGTEAYAREELVAEIASMMICGEIGIAPDLNRNTSYIGSWVQDLENHPMEICRAAQQADKALNFVLELERERMQERDPELQQSRTSSMVATSQLSPRFEVEYFQHWRQATDASIEHTDKFYAFEHEGQQLLALKDKERLYSVPNHMPIAGEEFESRTMVRAFNADGKMYNVIQSETLRRRADGDNDVVSERKPVEITASNRSVILPLNWTGEMTVRPCFQGKDGQVRTGDISEEKTEFYSVNAIRDDKAERLVKTFDTKEAAQQYADLMTNEYKRQNGQQIDTPVREPAEKHFIKVPYADRSEAKAQGATWDKDAKSWYVENAADALRLHAKWPTHDPATTQAELAAKQTERATRAAGQGKVFINVPKTEKDAAKELGARWDRNAVSWYVPPGVNPDPLTAKWPAHEPAAAVGQAVLHKESGQAAEKAARVLLSVPYKEKETAKAAGARWDGEVCKWYAGHNADMEKLAKWLPENRPEFTPTLPPREEFANVLKSIGADVSGEHPIMDKKSHRITVDGDKQGELSGFYVAHPDGRPSGYAKNNRTQEEQYWSAKGYILDDSEKKTLQDKALKTLEQREADRERQYNRTAAKLQTQVKNLEPITAPTPYMEAKGITPQVGAYASGKTICIPAYNTNAEIRSVQYINEDGTKRFAKNSQREGCFNIVGGPSALHKAQAIVISEGYATAATVSQALGHATVTAFDAGNLVPVAQALHRAMPDKPIIIAGDDDRHLEETGKVNVGKTKAEEAAKAVGGITVFPTFALGEREANPKGLTDFNDLAQKSKLGIDAVKSQVGAVVMRQVEKRKMEAEHAKTQEKEKGGKGAERD